MADVNQLFTALRNADAAGDVEAARRFAELIKQSLTPEPTVMGQVGEAVKGIIPGAIGLLETGITGAAAILPEEAEQAVRAKTKEIATAAKKPFEAAPGYEETVGRKLGEAIGSTVPFLPLGALGLAGRAGAVGLGTAAGAGEARTRAEAEGATEGERAAATGFGIIPGAAEAFAPLRILGRLGDDIVGGGVQIVKRAAAAGGEEAAQEAASAFAQNLIAKGIYKPEQELIEGLGEQAAYGGATGAIVQGLLDLAIGRRARGPAAPAAEQPAGLPATATQAELFTREEAPLAVTPDESAFAIRQEQMLEEGTRQENLIRLDELRNEFDTLQRENERLRTQYEAAETDEAKAKIKAQADNLSPALIQLETEIKKVSKKVGADEAARAKPARLVGEDGQLGLDFEAPVMERRKTPEGVVIGETAEIPGMTPAQSQFFQQARIDSIQQRLDAGEPITPMEQRLLQESKSAKQAAIDTAPTPDIRLPEEKRAAPPPFELVPSDQPQYARDVEGRVKRTTPYAPVVEEKPAAEQRLITEEDFKLLGIAPSNKKLRDEILGKDITKPKQRAFVREKLEEYAGAANRSPRIVSNVESFLSSGPFMEQTRFDFGAPKGAPDVTTTGEPVAGAVEPSVRVPKQQRAKPAAGAKPSVVSGVEAVSTDVTTPSVGEAGKPSALDPATRRGLDKFAEMIRKEPGAVDLNRRLVNLPTDQQRYVRSQLAPTFKAKFRQTPKGTKGNPKNVVEKLVNRMMAGWVNAPKTVVVQSISELPPYMREEIRDAQVNPKGAFDPRTETVYIVADNIVGYNDLVITVAHEAIGHYGLRSVLGGNYSRVLNNLYRTNDQVRAKADKKIKDGLDKETAIEEVLAEAVEEKVPADTLMGKAVQQLKNILRRVMQSFGVKTLNDREVQELLDSFSNYVVEGKGVRAEGVAGPQAGVFRKGKPALTAAGQQAQASIQAMGNISNAKPKQPQMSTMQKVGGFFFDPTLRQEQIDKFRVQVTSRYGSVERKLQDLYNGAIRDALGNIRPDLFVSAADHSDTLTVAVMKEGGIKLDSKIGWIAVKKNESLMGVMNKIKDLGVKLGDQDLAFKLANDAFIARRASALKKNPNSPVDPATLPSDPQIAAGMKAFQDFPELEAAFKEYTDFKNGLIDGMVAGGRLDAARAKEWKDAIDYVPWNRIKDYEEAIQNSPKSFQKGLVNLGDIKKLKGGTDEINNIFDNMVGLSFWMVNSAVRNHAALQLTDVFVKNNLGAKKVNPAASDVDPNKVVYIYRDGKPEAYEFDSMADVYAFKGIESIGGPILSSLTAASNVLRKTTTAMPQFAFSQLFQDSYRAMVMSGTRSPFKTAARVITGYLNAYNGDETTKMLERMGIVGMYDLMPGKAREGIEAEFGVKQTSAMNRALNFMESFSIASDAALRKAVFDQTLAETKSAQFPDGDVLLARYRAQEVINFKRQGVNRSVGVLRQIIPFMNAYIQGMDVLYRTMTGRGIAAEERSVAFRMFVGTGLKLTALSLIYTMLVGDDEEYEGLRGFEKDKNFIIPGTGVKIPVAPEVGFLFKVLPERTYNYIISQGTENPQDATALRKAFATAAFDAFSGPNLTPQLFKPALEVMVNYSFFMNKPIVGMGEQNKEPFLQFNDSTSELSKFLGGLANASPMKIEHFIRGMTGIAGGTALDLSNMLFADRPERRVYEMPFLKTFMYDKIPGGYKEQYYDLRDRVDTVADTINALKAAGRVEELEQYMTDERLQLLALRKTMNRIDERFEKIRALKKVISADPNMDKGEKRDVLDQLNQTENELLKAYNIPVLRKEVGGL